MPNQPEDIVLPVSKTTVTTEHLGVTLKKLTIEPATANSAGKVKMELAALDEAGNWLEGASSVVLRREDLLFESDPQKRYAASMIHELMLSAIVTDTPTHRALGIVGLSVKDAAKVIVNATEETTS